MSLWPLWLCALVIWAPTVWTLLMGKEQIDLIGWSLIAGWLIVLTTFLQGTIK